MEAKELIESLEKGWPGWLALGFVILKESGISSKIFGLFVNRHEQRQALEIKQAEQNVESEAKIRDLGVRYLEKTLENNTKNNEQLVAIKEEVASIKTLNNAQLDAIRALLSEVFVFKTKLDQILKEVMLKKRGGG